MSARRYATLLGVVLVYMASSSAEVLVVKVLNYNLHVRGACTCNALACMEEAQVHCTCPSPSFPLQVSLVILTAMLLNAYCLIQAPMYLCMRRGTGRVLTWRQLGGYAVIGSLAAAVTGTRSFGLNALPASVYVVCATSDLVFNTILSKIFLGKSFTLFHYAAVAIALAGIVLVATEDSKSNKYDCDGDTCADDFLPGILMTLGSALCSAINAVLADKLLNVDKKTLLGVAEVSLFNSAIPFCILWIPLLATKEYTRYDDALRSVQAQHAVAAFVACCVALGLAKMIDRASKFTLVLMKSAFFYAIVDSFRKVLTGIIAIWAFGEANSWQKYVALALTALAMAVYTYGSRQKQLASKQAAAGKREPGSVVEGDAQEALLAEQRLPSTRALSISSSHRGASDASALSSALEELEDSMYTVGLSQSPGVITFPESLAAAMERAGHDSPAQPV